MTDLETTAQTEEKELLPEEQPAKKRLFGKKEKKKKTPKQEVIEWIITLGAALVIAGLAAEGVTEIEEIGYIERGYEDIVEKLRRLGADITRVTVADTPAMAKAN